MGQEDDSLDLLLDWLDSVKLSRPKRNLARDFSDGVLIAELLKNFYPRYVEMHNYSPANSYANKMENWDVLNKKVLSVVGLPQSSSNLNKFATSCKGAIEELLWAIKEKIDSTTVKRNEGGKIVYTYLDTSEEINLESMPSYNIVPLNEFNKLNEQLKSKIEDIDTLNAKVIHLESLINLKDQRIMDLTSQLRRCHCQGGRAK